ncbi:TIGR02452 family protein [Actinocrinis sp.]|uniref:TIGR02452 family protein n=1 Tax=Actinocrinis sp. TaxID=1920516 RepID=UPI002C5FFAD1|nr:TIGR02452 family protein [Actinocrinis sp.]HXR69208.1 TIGR02452 family protein [Actinocrinis sp.]
MSAQLRQVAAENQAIVAAGRYKTPDGEEIEVASMLAAAVAGTRSYGSAELTGPSNREGTLAAAGAHAVRDNGFKTAMEVTGEDTITAARRLVAAPGGRVAVLNFASARHPGGGYLSGAKAQEEDICRKTLLYPCLLAAPDYYADHEKARDPFYSHRLVYSPGVPVIRDVHNRLTAPVITIDVITCAAPNAGVLERYRPEQVGRIPEQLTERSGAVLEAATRHGARRLVLGAWGCGVFHNDPRHVAAAFNAHLTGDGAYRDVFEHITFAVLDRSVRQQNLGAFRDAFEG